MPVQPTVDHEESPPAAFACPRCRAPMRVLSLSSHKGAALDVEHCDGCRLVWFDRFESVHLDAAGWVRLLRVMEAGARQPLADAQAERPACPVCAGPLATVHNRSRFGLFAALECRHGHGHLHSHSGLLAERGLVRPLGVAERRALAEEKLALHCLNCGGPAGPGADTCRYCHTPLVVLDLPRLAHSLRPTSERMAASPRGLGHHVAWPCRGCGAPLDPGRETRCSHCGHMVVAQGLPDIDPMLAAAEADLAALAAAEAQRLSRYPSVQQRQPGAARPAVLVARGPAPWLQRAMLGGWLPLWLLLAAAAVLAVQAFTSVLSEPPTPLRALRGQRLATAPGSGWVWLPAYRALKPDDRPGRNALRQGLFDVYLRQLDGEALPATLTVGQVMDGDLPVPKALADRSPLARWDRLLSAYLQRVPGDTELPQVDEVTGSDTRWTPAAPGVWVDRDQRSSAALWVLTLQNTGPVSLRPGRLTLRTPNARHDALQARCQPAPGAGPTVPPHGLLKLVCRCNTGGEAWRIVMFSLQNGEPLDMAWHDDGTASAEGFEAETDRLAAVAQVETPPGVQAAPPLTWRERWSMLPDGRRALAGIAVALAAFVGFCALARGWGERTARRGSLLLAAPLCWWMARGDGAASVALAAMYLSAAAVVAFVFSFGFRFYRDTVFRHFGPRP